MKKKDIKFFLFMEIREGGRRTPSTVGQIDRAGCSLAISNNIQLFNIRTNFLYINKEKKIAQVYFTAFMCLSIHLSVYFTGMPLLHPKKTCKICPNILLN